MLYAVFETVVKMNIAASFTAAAVLTVKYILERLGLPRRVMFLLWIVIAFRLVCPTAPQSRLSVMNLFTRETAVEQSAGYMDKTDEAVAAVGSDKTSALPDVIAVIWLCGAAVMLARGAVSYARLKRRLRFAVRYEGNVYFADDIPTAFVLGVLRPKIYIPSGTERLEYVIVHERTHIRRFDHISKLLAYALLSANWFNPVNWLLFRFFSDDIELACDERVTAPLNAEARKEYMSALLDAATGKNGVKIPYHVCFSESITKRRIKAMLKVKKLSAPVAAAAVICCVIAGAAFGTGAVTAKQPSASEQYSAEPSIMPMPTDVSTARAAQSTPQPETEHITPTISPEFDEDDLNSADSSTMPNAPYTEPIPDNADMPKDMETGAAFGKNVGNDTFQSTRLPDGIVNNPISSAKETLPAAEDNSGGTSSYDNFNPAAPTASDTAPTNEPQQNTPASSEDERADNEKTDNNADVVGKPIVAEKTEDLSFDENGNLILPEGWLTEEEMQDKFGYIVVHFGQAEITADHSTDEEKAAIRESYDKVADRVGSEAALERFEHAFGKEYMHEITSE